MAWSQPIIKILPLLHVVVAGDNELKNIRELCFKGTPPHPNYSTYDELLYWNGRLVIPKNHDLVKNILHDFHSSPLGGHSGVTRTMSRITTKFHWHGMHKDIVDVVKQCLICQQAKSANTLPLGLLQLLPILEQISDDITMDFIMGLPNSSGFTVIMTMVDRLSKYARFASLKADYTST